MKQVIPSRSVRDPFHISRRASLRGQFFAQDNEAITFSAPGVLKNLSVKLRGSGAPGAGNSINYKVQKTTVLDGSGAGWTDTAIIATIADAALSASDAVNSETVSVADTMYRVLRTASGVDLESTIATEEWTLTFESDDTVTSAYGSFHGPGTIRTDPSGIVFAPFHCMGNDGMFGRAGVCPLACTVIRHDIFSHTGPGGGNSITCVWNVNGVDQDGSGGTVDTRATYSDAATHAVKTFALVLAAGDVVKCRLYSSNNPSNLLQFWHSCAVQSDTAGDYILAGDTIGAIAGSSQQFVCVVDSTWTWSGTETDQDITVGLDALVLKALYIRATAAPDVGGGTAGASLTFVNRKNGADGGISVALTTGVSGNDPTHPTSYASGDTLPALAVTGSGSQNAATRIVWAYGVGDPSIRRGWGPLLGQQRNRLVRAA